MNLPAQNIVRDAQENTDSQNLNLSLNEALENMIRFSGLLNRLTQQFSAEIRTDSPNTGAAEPSRKNMPEQIPKNPDAEFPRVSGTSDSGGTENILREIQRSAEIAERILRETGKIQKTLNRIQNDNDSVNPVYQ